MPALAGAEAVCPVEMVLAPPPASGPTVQAALRPISVALAAAVSRASVLILAPPAAAWKHPTVVATAEPAEKAPVLLSTQAPSVLAPAHPTQVWFPPAISDTTTA